MTVLVTRNPNLFLDIGWTPRLDDSAPVAMGTPIIEAGPNPRIAVIHNFSEDTKTFIDLYCAGENPGIEIMDAMPVDWNYPTGPA